MKLDEIADHRIEKALEQCKYVAGFASEEKDNFISFDSKDGEYIIVYDPLDGSQNVPPGLSVGAIYGIFKAKDIKDIKKGEEIVAAGYAIFSTALQFCFTTKNTPVELSQYNFQDEGWFVYDKDFKRPKKGKTYAINEGSVGNWDSTISTFVSQHLRGRSVRWMCSMVADTHRQLLQGGCFLYPSDKKYPKGRLRLVYEAIPLAFIWEKAGNGSAYATVEGLRILDVPFPTEDIHARCGVIFLGEEESTNFHKVKSHAPLWNGGKLKDKIIVKETAQVSAVKQQITLLTTALVVGAVFNIFLLVKGNGK